MNSILYSVFISLALRMSVITAIILIIKRAFKSKLSAKAQCAVWLIAAAQFIFCLCGVRIRTKSSVYNVIPQAARTAAAQAPSAMTDARNIVTLVWLIGAALLAVWYIAVFVSYRRKIRTFPVITDRETLAALGEVKAALGIDASERIELRLGDTAQTLMRLVILPEGYSQSETKQILLHELCHYKHRDSLKLCLGLAALCVNWFNPLIWIAFHSFRTDIEMLCDDRVLQLTDSKKEYASVLVKSATVRSGFVPGAVSVHNGKNEVIRRVKRIVNLKKNKPVWLVVMMALSVAVSCLCLTDAVTAAVEKKSDAVSTTPAPITAPTAKTPEPTTAPLADAQTADDSEAETNDHSEPEQDPRPEDHSEPRYNTEPENYSEPEQNPRSEYSSEQEYDAGSEPSYFSEPETYTYDEPDYSSSYSYSAPQTGYESGDPEVEIGADRSDVYSSMGEPDSVSSGGSKEEYVLDDGSTAILQYDGDTLKQGYIVD